MITILYAELVLFWAAWWYPILFQGPHFQKRHSIVARGPTLAGLFFQTAAACLAFAGYFPLAIPRSPLRIALSIAFGAAAPILSWASVSNLGRQFRITAGLYDDHELVTTGPYSVVRHPVYTSLLLILLCTLSLLTPLRWAALSIVLFVVGTEIRVRTEDGLLASRFGERFTRYRSSVPAYIPFVR